MLDKFTLFKHLVEKSSVNDRSAKRSLIVTTTLDGFSLAKKLQMICQICQTFYLPNFSTIRYLHSIGTVASCIMLRLSTTVVLLLTNKS